MFTITLQIGDLETEKMADIAALQAKWAGKQEGGRTKANRKVSTKAADDEEEEEAAPKTRTRRSSSKKKEDLMPTIQEKVALLKEDFREDIQAELKEIGARSVSKIKVADRADFLAFLEELEEEL